MISADPPVVAAATVTGTTIVVGIVDVTTMVVAIAVAASGRSTMTALTVATDLVISIVTSRPRVNTDMSHVAAELTTIVNLVAAAMLQKMPTVVEVDLSMPVPANPVPNLVLIPALIPVLTFVTTVTHVDR